MTITLIRHARVNYEFKKSYRHFDFDKSCTEYDNSPVLQDIEHRANSITGNIIYVSSLIRTHETAQLLFSGIVPIENKLFDEVPIKSYAPLPIPLPTALWFGIGRLQWLFASKRQPETKANTKNRVRKAVDTLVANDDDVILISHGFFMRLLVKELERRGFALEKKASYKNLDHIRMTNQPTN
jgi:broad specificity phosphatase PhoE